MGAALTDSTIVYSTNIDGSSKSALVEDLNAAATLAGWNGSAISGGYSYVLTSPQLLTCRCNIWEDGSDANHVKVQFLSEDEEREGYTHLLRVGTGIIYRAHVNLCQLFVGTASTARTQQHCAVQGGILSVPDPGIEREDCEPALGPVLTTECWWSCGGASNGHFRWAHESDVLWSACHNADLLRPDLESFGENEKLRILPVGIGVGIPNDFWHNILQRTYRYVNTSVLDPQPMYFDPLVGWGRGLLRVRGQLWDAIMPSLPRDLDYEETVMEADWVNYLAIPEGESGPTLTNFPRFGCLYLLKGIPSERFSTGGYVY